MSARGWDGTACEAAAPSATAPSCASCPAVQLGSVTVETAASTSSGMLTTAGPAGGPAGWTVPTSVPGAVAASTPVAPARARVPLGAVPAPQLGVPAVLAVPPAPTECV